MQYDIEEMLDRKRVVIKECMPKVPLASILNEIEKLNRDGTVLQVFDANSIVNDDHLLFAYANAAIAKIEKTSKVNSMALEMLCFAALTMQIDDAINLCGARSGSEMIIFSNSKPAYKKIEHMLSKIKDFNGSTEALAKLGAASFDDLVQKMALLSISD